MKLMLFYVERSDPSAERLNMLKKLQIYNLKFIKIEFFHIYSHQKASLKRYGNYILT